MDEVRLAVYKWYRIREIYDVVEYKVNRYGPETCEVGLFRGYKDMFL